MNRSMTMQTIWVCEFQPIPPHGVGGYDWYYDYQECLKQFNDHRNNGNLFSHEIGMYSVQLPHGWSSDAIQVWTEDYCNVLPRYCDTIAPATAGDD
jgi:hypothetical protein